MPLISPWRRITRAFAFGRHVPPSQLWRRIRLGLRRKYRDRTGWPAPILLPAPPLAATPLRPLFPPRGGMLALGAAGPTFTFLGRAQAMQGEVDWGAPSLAPRDQLWRMHLHYMEYLEAVDDQAFVTLVEAWIAANGAVSRGAWRDAWNAYALSLRAVVWMQQLAVRRERIAPATLPRVTASLAQQIAFLADNLETDIGGNHLIKNIKALLWASAFFEGDASAKWQALGLRALEAALAEQVLADGVHYERSPSYHAQVFADLLECRHALGARAPGALDAALRAMAQAVADLAHPDGLAAQFNDSGLHMAYAPGACLDAYAALMGARPAARLGFALSFAGYFGRRAGEDYLVIDCGRIGPDALPAHAHGDILSFEWSVAGERIVVDPGVYEYFQGPRRAASRSAMSHNTLCFEGADQADFFGAFRCGRRPDVELRRFECDDERLILEGTHNGFRPIGAHVRRFEATDAGLAIFDAIEAAPTQRATIGFLLHPDVVVERAHSLLPLAGEGGAKRRMRGFVQNVALSKDPHADPLPQAGEGARKRRLALPAPTLMLRRGEARILVRSTSKIVCEDAVWQPDLGYEHATKRLRMTWEGGRGEVVTTFEIQASQTPRDT